MKEKDMAEALRGKDGMVKYFGCFQSSETHDESTTQYYNLVLELGKMDLSEAFKAHSPPMSPKGVWDFWDQLKDISDALESIHKIIIDNLNYNV